MTTALTLALLPSLARAEPLVEEITVRPTGFLDIGWFEVQGDGTSYRRYDACLSSPCLGEERLDTMRESRGWVYTGDPWASTVNSQGDPADLGSESNDQQPFDRIDSDGRPGFLLNTVALGASARAGDLDAVASVWLEPGNGGAGTPGDLVSLDLGYVSWRPGRGSLVWRAGKMESSFGYEWRHRTAALRETVTPSLMARYTVGTPIGIAAEIGRDVKLMASLANGGNNTERFGHFQDDFDVNGVPTGTIHIEGGPKSLTVGLSGQTGAADGTQTVVPMLQVGCDLQWTVGSFNLSAEYMVVRQDLMEEVHPNIDHLRAHGGYLLLTKRIGSVTPLLRLDTRFATLDRPEVSHVYLSEVARATVGARWQPASQLQLKAEYLWVLELFGPEIPDNVLTSSLVFSI